MIFMPFKSSFLDNESYDAADLNNIYRRLIYGSETDVFGKQDGYTAAHLNALTEKMCTDGVVHASDDSLSVWKITGQNAVFISPGTAVFSDGAVMEIDAGGHELAFSEGVKQYVYLKRNAEGCFPVCTADAPAADGSCVPLAEISQSGAVIDRRTFARCKNKGYCSSAGHIILVSVRVNCSETRYSDRYFGSTAVELGDGGQHRFAFAEYAGEGTFGSYHTAYSFCDLKNNVYAGLYTSKNLSDGSTITSENLYSRMCMKIDGRDGKFVFCTMRYVNGRLEISADSDVDGEISFSFLLF